MNITLCAHIVPYHYYTALGRPKWTRAAAAAAAGRAVLSEFTHWRAFRLVHIIIMRHAGSRSTLCIHGTWKCSATRAAAMTVVVLSCAISTTRVTVLSALYTGFTASRTVYSHPMCAREVEKFLGTHPPSAKPTDTHTMSLVVYLCSSICFFFFYELCV